MDEWMGSPTLAMAAAATPAAVGFAASRLCNMTAAQARTATALSALAAGVFAIAAGLLFAWQGPTTGVLGWISLPGGLSVSLGARIDGLSVAMLLTVTLIGAVVSRYAIRYLDGDPEQARFSQWLAYTISAVLVVIIASNLALFFAGWLATSHGLHRLLTHWGDRPAALLAARKKFLISRLGDVLIVAALGLVLRDFGSLEYAEIFDRIAAGAGEGAFPIALLLVLGAMTKSAQFPFHTWLPDSMETPTPVSALMHAGIINAGGFLLIRMSPLLTAAPEVLPPLALGGAFTALLGSVAMLTQTDVKRKYAYSTVAQMGFMMLQCGLGAFAAAALHMVGHAFYKGYAFLSAGAVVDPEPAGPKSQPAATALEVVAATAIGAAVVATVAWVVGADPSAKPGLPVLCGVLALATAQLVLGGARGQRRLASAGLSIALGASAVFAYFAGVALFDRLLVASLPSQLPPVAPGLTLVLLALFALAFATQHAIASGRSAHFARAFWVHASNGFYLGSIQRRWVEWLWPLPTSRDISSQGAER